MPHTKHRTYMLSERLVWATYERRMSGFEVEHWTACTVEATTPRHGETWLTYCSSFAPLPGVDGLNYWQCDSMHTLAIACLDLCIQHTHTCVRADPVPPGGHVCQPGVLYDHRGVLLCQPREMRCEPSVASLDRVGYHTNPARGYVRPARRYTSLPKW